MLHCVTGETVADVSEITVPSSSGSSSQRRELLDSEDKTL
jgi:hypothetical protein